MRAHDAVRAEHQLVARDDGGRAGEHREGAGAACARRRVEQGRGRLCHQGDFGRLPQAGGDQVLGL